MLPWLVWWTACWWGFLLLAGDWNRIEWIAAACIATVAATLIEAVRVAARVDARLALGPLRQLPAALARVLPDFGLLAVALLRRRAGTYVVRDGDPGDATQQAWTVFVANVSPNSYVVDLDRKRGSTLLHDVVPSRRSERPA